MKVMLRRLGYLLVAGSVGLGSLQLQAMAQGKPNVSMLDALRVLSGVSMAVSSHELFEIAQKDNDPYAMITAAKLRKKAGLKEVPLPSEEEGGAAHTDTSDPTILSWEAMLDAAVKMSNGDETVAELAEDVRSSRSKGVVDGAVFSNAKIKPRGKRRYSNLTFEGGKYAEVYSEGRGQANLDMFVYDANGHLICSQTDPSNISQCGWTPSFTGKFSVVMENKSDVSASYALMSN